MLIEHLIYNIAIAILIYTIYEKRYVLSIIILSTYSPDIDFVTDSILKKIGITLLIYGDPIKHGDFHNILVLIIYGILVALLLNTIKIKMIDSFILASIGFTAHLFEDYIVFNPGYRFFWPISDKIYGIGLIKYNADFYGIANKDVLIVGLIFIILCVIIGMKKGIITLKGEIKNENWKRNSREKV